MIEFDYRPPDVPLVVLYQDAQVIVVDKPAGLLSVPGKLEGRRDCLELRLRAAFWDSLLVHRLDCDTSGVMIFARTKAAQGFLGQEFEQRAWPGSARPGPARRSDSCWCRTAP